MEEEVYKNGTMETRDLRRDNERRGMQEWDNVERRISEGIMEEEGCKNGTMENEGS
jgi:hypothetical protein